MIKSIHSALWEWFGQCPAATKRFFNFGMAEDSSTILATAGDTLLDDYIDGSQRRRYAFELNWIGPFTTEENDPGNIEIMEDVQEIISWVEEQISAGNLPRLPANCVLDGMEVLDEYAGYATALDNNTAKYMIPMAIDYIKTKG